MSDNSLWYGRILKFSMVVSILLHFDLSCLLLSCCRAAVPFHVLLVVVISVFLPCSRNVV